MPSLTNQEGIIPKERLLTVISLIMVIEHKFLSLNEIMKATGMTFNEARAAMQNLVNTRLIQVIPTDKGIPSFKLIDENCGRQFLELAGVKSEQD